MNNTADDSMASPPAMSFGARLLNVFVAPGEVFEFIKTGPTSVMNWLIPVLLSCFIGIGAFLIIQAQPAVQQQMQEMQDQQMQKLVEQNKISPEQAERMKEMGLRVGRIFAPIGIAFGVFTWFFAQVTYLWLVGAKICKAQFSYLQMMDVVGLTTLIAIVGQIATALLIIGQGNLTATLGPALFIPQFDATKASHQFLQMIQLPAIWYYSVLALGWAKLSAMRWTKSLFIVFVSWICLRAVGILFTTLVTSLQAG